MKKAKTFKIIWNYLKHDKLKLIIYVLLVLINYTPGLISPILWGHALESLIEKDATGFFNYILMWECMYILCYTILQVPKDLIYNKLEIKFIKNVSNDMYKKINNLPAIAFEKIGVGEFINRLYNDTDRVMELMSKMIRMICKSFIVIAFFVVAFNISFIIGLELVIFAISIFMVSFLFFPKIKKKHSEIKKEADEYVKVATENITGIREIKSLGIKSQVENIIRKNLDRLYTHTKKVRIYETIYYNLDNLIYYVLQFVILITTGYMFIKGKIALAAFTMIESYIWRTADLVESISDFGVSYNKVTVSLKRIDELLNNKLYDDEKFGNKELKNTKGIIKFKNVKFKYNEDEKYTLNGLNMTFEPNKKIAVVGRSGNGKSTIFNLLLRYFDATKGTITIDGIDIRDLTEDSLRKNISIIRQTPFLFNMSILDNLKLVKPNAKLKDIREVCKKAYIDDYIMSLPKKYNTIIGEGGVNLSGGQKQRLAIARTLLLNTKIILFDEATSALDNASQDYIKKTIDNLVKDHTVIIVAHRLSTIVDADVINVIDKGLLVGNGTHKELLKSCDAYKSLYNSEL